MPSKIPSLHPGVFIHIAPLSRGDVLYPFSYSNCSPYLAANGQASNTPANPSSCPSCMR